MAFATLVGVGGLSPGLFSPSRSLSCSSSTSVSAPFILRAGGGGGARRHGLRRLVTPLRGSACRGESTNSRVLQCANEANVVTEDDIVNDGIDDETASDAEMDEDAEANGDESSDTDEDASVSWIEQQPLPYPSDALEPYISKETVEQHWGVHQNIHVERLNGMIGGSEWEGMSLGQMMLSSFNEGREAPHPPFFHAAQIWNHDFYWRSMQPGGGGKPPERLLKFINRDFGSYDGMIRQFMDAASTQFGSGWVWLCYKTSKLPHVKSRSPIPSDNYGRLVISKSPNAINPLVWGHSPLLAIDLWEDRRSDYVSTFLEKLVSWETVESRLKKAVQRAVERDEYVSTKHIRKQLLARAKSRIRAMPQQVNGDAREQTSSQEKSLGV
uniref:superoxide dismutase n=1 Tax=Oryza meridionalis TaxID=40149 RepID=A0A0E0DVU3_9ORYZ